MATLKKLYRLLSPDRLLLPAAMLCAFVATMTSLLAPLTVGSIIDSLSPARYQLSSLQSLLWRLVFLYALGALCQWALSLAVTRLGYRAAWRLRVQCFTRLNKLSVRRLDTLKVGDLQTRLTMDAELVGEGIVTGIPQLFMGVVAIIGTLAAMFSMNFWLGLVVVLLTPLSVVLAKRITLVSHRYNRDRAQAQGELGGLMAERLNAHSLVSVMNAQRANNETFNQSNDHFQKIGYKAELYGALVNPLTRFVNHLVYVAVGLVGGLLVLQGMLSIGQLSAFINYAGQYTKPFNEISAVINQLQQAQAAFERLNAIIDLPDEEVDADNAITINAALGAMVFDKVSFRYEPSRPLIEDLNLSVSPGSKIAIVGPTGAGKTTLANLMLRFFDVDSGRILLDGLDIRQLSYESLRAQFGLVLQDSVVFTGTVRQNIALGRPGATDDEVEKAARLAQAHGFIRRLPQGYDTPIGPDSGLSKGQQQLIALARVMLKDPPILLLDEATSAIDTLTEALVTRAFDQLTKGRSSFVIAHRLSTIRQADLILVMDKGHVVEAGRHEELLNQQGFYYRLYQSQFDLGLAEDLSGSV